MSGIARSSIRKLENFLRQLDRLAKEEGNPLLRSCLPAVAGHQVLDISHDVPQQLIVCLDRPTWSRVILLDRALRLITQCRAPWLVCAIVVHTWTGRRIEVRFFQLTGANRLPPPEPYAREAVGTMVRRVRSELDDLRDRGLKIGSTQVSKYSAGLGTRML